MTIEKSGFVLTPEQARGRTMTVFGQTITERITAEDSGGDYYIFDEVTPPGFGVPPHHETREDEVVLVRDGLFDVFVNGTVTQAGPGAILNFARGTWHGFRCVGPDAGHTTWIVTPGANGQAFLRELATFPPGPPDHARLDTLHEKHGITMPPPSPTWW